MTQPRTLVFVSAIAAMLVAAGACAPAAAPANPAATASNKAGANPAAAADWDQIVAAAKKEGVLALAGPTGSARRDVLTQGFEKEYGISVEFWGASGSELSARVNTERQAGQYLWDVYIAGTSTALQELMPMNALDPLEPMLVSPELKDPKSWLSGSLEFADSGRRNLVFTPSQRGTLFIHTNLVKGDEFTSYKDLLDPKWKGKIASDDPRKSGPGQATFTFFFLHPELGPDFIRALGTQELTLLRDYNQEVDMVAQGRFPVGLGFDDALVDAKTRQGVPIGIVSPRTLREGSDVSPSVGSVGVFNKAPHPNATKVYLNWLLSKETQTDFARATGYVSARAGVPTDHTFDWRVPQPNAIKTYTEQAMAVKDPLLALVTEVFGKA